MEIIVQLDETLSQPQVILRTPAMTEEVQEVLRRLGGPEGPAEARFPAPAPEGFPHPGILGYREGLVRLLKPEEVFRFFTQKGRVHAQTAEGDYQLRLRLYQLEELLEPGRFIRISNGELVQLDQVRHFDLRLSGTIRVMLACGTVTYASRRYVAKIKQTLGL